MKKTNKTTFVSTFDGDACIVPPMTIKIDREMIRQRIRELGYTHAGVASRAQISAHTLGQMLSGKYGTPKSFTRKRLAHVLEVDEEVIFPVVDATKERAS